MKNKILIMLILLALGTGLLTAEPDEKKQNTGIDELRTVAPNVFLDCERWTCDINYIRTEITFVNYVRDGQSADIHILVTRQRTGSGGNEYTIAFIGLKRFKDRESTLKFFSKPTDSRNEIRKGMVNVLKQGLIPYVSDTPLAEFISISYERQAPEKPTLVYDKWNYWVFSVGLEGELDYEELSKQSSYEISLSANRTTEASKFRFWANGRFNDERYTVDEDEEIVSKSNRKYVYTQFVKSLNDHWSFGPSLSLYGSTYDNLELSATIGPAIEYNIFPYSESTRRELRIQYQLGYRYRNYYETTLLGKNEESLLHHTLQVNLEVKETWGSVGMEVEGQSYLHDLSKNNLKVEAGLHFRIFKGFSCEVRGEYSRVRDQIELPREGATKDEILLQLKRLATTYDLSLEFGIRYRFGSIYSNVVNPRFGNR